MAAYSAVLRGASRIFVVDRVPERLEVATKIGCTAIDFSQGNAVEMIIEANGGMVDRSVDAVGYQAVGSSEGNQEVPNIVLEQCIAVTRPTGGLGIPGLYVPSDPGAPDEKSKNGMMSLSFGKLFEKVCWIWGPPILFFLANSCNCKGLLQCDVSGPKSWHGPMQCQEVQSLPP